MVAAGHGRFEPFAGGRSAATNVEGEGAFFSDADFFGFLTSRLDLLCPLAMEAPWR
jgi:hypothetical protein